jgi:hypothetical protein
MFDHFWDLDSLVEDEAPGKAEIVGSQTPFCGIFGFRVYVMGMGCRPMSFTDAYTPFVMYKKISRRCKK